jgi:hypothetical protein
MTWNLRRYTIQRVGLQVSVDMTGGLQVAFIRHMEMVVVLEVGVDTGYKIVTSQSGK